MLPTAPPAIVAEAEMAMPIATRKSIVVTTAETSPMALEAKEARRLLPT